MDARETHLAAFERAIGAPAGELDVSLLDWTIVEALEKVDPHVKAALDLASSLNPETGGRRFRLDRAQSLFLLITVLASAKAQALDQIARLRRDLIESRALLAKAKAR